MSMLLLMVKYLSAWSTIQTCWRPRHSEAHDTAGAPLLDLLVREFGSVDIEVLISITECTMEANLPLVGCTSSSKCPSS